MQIRSKQKKIFGFITASILAILFLPLTNAFAYTEAELCVNPDKDHCFFVAEDGSDTTGDGSLTKPYRTLAPLFSVGGNYSAKLDKADSQLRTVVMRAGDYHHAGTVYLRRSNVVLKNWPGERPRVWLEGDNSANTHRLTLGVGYSGYSCENVTVEGLDIEGGYSYALKIYENTKDVTIRGNKIHGSGYDVIKIVGCGVSGNLDYDNYLCNQNALIEDNEIYDSGLKSTIGDEGIDAMGTYNTIVRHNYFHDIQGSGLYFKGHSKGIIVEENFFYNTGTGGLDPNNVNDTWGGLWLGDDSMLAYIPEPPHNYEIEDSIARNNIIANTQGDALRVMSCKNCSVYNNTVYNKNRKEFPRGYLTDYSGSFSIFKNAKKSIDGIWADELRLRNAEVYFRNNIVVDSIEQGYGIQLPIVAINGPFYNGRNSDHLNMRNNIYYRRDGDYRFRNYSSEEAVTGSTSIDEWQQVSALDQNSKIASNPGTLLRIMADASLPENDPKSYLQTINSEALTLDAGAYIDLSVSPWTEWFPETCSDGQTRSCVTTHSCEGLQTCSGSTWSSCQDIVGDSCPGTCVDNDNDGYGKPASFACQFPDLDCNDSNPNVNPGHLEICGNGEDDDCRSGDEACKQCVTGDTVFGQIHAKGCICEGEQRYTGYCCEGNIYNPYTACGYEECRPNQFCVTNSNCSGTCDALGTACIDNTADSCPSFILQDGLDGYSGTKDTSLLSTKPTSVSGSSGALGLWTEGSAEYKFVIEFDISSIPQGSKIKDCILQIYTTSSELSRTSKKNISARRILRPWVESQVTWNKANSSTYWALAGADADGLDRNLTPLVTHNPTKPDLILYRMTDTWASFNLLESGDNIAEKWLDGTYPNYGLVFEIDTLDARGMGFASKENSLGQEFKPRLIINLEGQGSLPPPPPPLNQPPVLDSIGNRSINEGESLTFNISATDPDGDTLTYSASSLPQGAIFINQAFSWRPDYGQAGEYLVTFSVSDGAEIDSEDITITVNKIDNSPPAITITSPGDNAIVFESPIQVSGTVSDALSSIASVKVNAEEVALSNSSFSALVALELGENIITVTASDAASNTAEVSITVTLDTAPTGGITLTASASPTSGTAPLTVDFQAQASSTEGAIVRYEWDLEGHNTFRMKQVVSSPDVSYIYTAAGLYVATVKAIDSAGNYETYSFAINVNANPDAPTVALSADTTSASTPLRVKFTANAKAANTISKYEWDFDGDGVFELNSSRSSKVIHTYIVAGVYQARIKVTDSKGLSAEDQVIIDARSIKGTPEFSIVTDRVSGKVPLLVNFTVNKDNDFTALKYEWDFDGDKVVDLVSNSPEGAFTYRNAGTFDVVLKIITDKSIAGLGYKQIKIKGPEKDSDESGSTVLSSLSLSQATGIAPLLVTFANASQNSIESLYDFDGDGSFDLSSKAAEFKTYLYKNPGLYTPLLRVLGTGGDVSFASRIIWINDAVAKPIMTEPSNGKTLAGDSIGLVADAPVGIDILKLSFEFKAYNETTWQEVSNSLTEFPYNLKWDVSGLADSKEYNIRAKVIDAGGGEYISDAITITLDNNDSNPDIRETTANAQGEYTKEVKINKEENYTISLWDGTVIIVPQGALGAEDKLIMNIADPALVPNKLEGQDLADARQYKKFSLESGRYLFDKDLTLVIPYPDLNNDGIVDGTSINVETLSIYQFNEASNVWQKVNSTIDLIEKTVRVKINHFSLFGLGGLGEDGDDVSSDSDSPILPVSTSEGGGGGSCFIATAAFGSPLEEEVKTLSEFRDRYLLSNRAGEMFVRFYYQHSPKLAEFIKDKESLKVAIRLFLKPLVNLSKFLLEAGG